MPDNNNGDRESLRKGQTIGRGSPRQQPPPREVQRGQTIGQGSPNQKPPPKPAKK